MTAPDLAAFGPRLRERILDALALLGGTGSTSEVRGKVEAAGFPVTLGRVGVRLHEMAREVPPPVSRVGGRRDGADGSRLWKLGAPEAGEDGPETAFPPREDPQPEVAGRAPLCEACWHLEDAVGHFWAHGGLRGRLR